MLVENYHGQVITEIDKFQCVRCGTDVCGKKCFNTPELNYLCDSMCCPNCQDFACLARPQDDREALESKEQDQQWYLKRVKRYEASQFTTHSLNTFKFKF